MKSTFQLLVVILLAGLLINACSTTQNFQGAESHDQKQENESETSSEDRVIVTGHRIKRSDRNQTSREEAKRQKARRSARKVAEARVEAERAETQTSPASVIFHDRLVKDNLQIFKRYGVNPTISTANNPVSTFAMDVDDGAYKLAKAMINKGRMPDTDGIRIEEFVNAFDYDYTPTDELFSLNAEVMPSPFRKGYYLMHLGAKVRDINQRERKPTNLVVILDISGSMNSSDKLPLAKTAIKTLIGQLENDDHLALVLYNQDAHVFLEPTPLTNRRAISEMVEQIAADGSTNAQAGLELGYQVAHSMFDLGANNRVILMSDGVANVGAVTPTEIVNSIGAEREQGIFLSTIGVGTDNYNDWLLEQLANQGAGHYHFMGEEKDIRLAFVDNLAKFLQPMAKDAKIQVVFNPELVSDYRLLGYENRGLKDNQFLDASVPGGLLSAGHRTTAIYEVRLVDPHLQDDLGRFSIAYKKPLGIKVFTISKKIAPSVLNHSTRQASSDMKLSVAAAMFAEKLRATYWSRFYSYSDIQGVLQSLDERNNRQAEELYQLIAGASSLDRREDRFEQEYPKSSVNFERVPLLK